MNAPKTSGAAQARRWRLLGAAAAAALVLGGAAEMLYRASWTLRAGRPAGGAEEGYFSLYIVGESTAAGEPYNGQPNVPGRPITLAALVSSLLGDRFQGREVRVFDLSRSGESVYPQSVALEQALRLRGGAAPGAVLVYAGHNDAMSPHGPLPLEWFRENVLDRSMLLSDLSFHAEKLLPFLRVRTPRTYERHLRRIVEMSLKSGLVPVLSTLVSNTADIDPGLFPGERLSPRHPRRAGLSLAEITAMLEKGQALEDQGRAGAALSYYLAQAGEHPQARAYLEYRAGKCYQAAGRYEDAARSYRRALDLSAFDNFPRATGRQNDFIRALGKQYAVPVVDVAAIFERNSPHGLPGNELFADGVHPNITGYLLLANACARSIAGAFNEPVKKQWAGPEEVFSYFSYGKQRQANALITSGRYLFNIAALHACPGRRLRTARARFRGAVELDPDSFSAWLALGLAEAALRGALLSDEESVDWLLKHGLGTYHRGQFYLAPDQLPEVLAKLASFGPPESIAAEVPRGAALKQGLGPGGRGEYALTRGQLLEILRKLYPVSGSG